MTNEIKEELNIIVTGLTLMAFGAVVGALAHRSYVKKKEEQGVPPPEGSEVPYAPVED